MQRGLKWRVTDGKSIKIWEDNWISNSVGLTTINKPLDDCTLIEVEELIDVQRGYWKEHLVDQLFCPQEGCQIHQIPLNFCGIKDLIWNP